MSLAEIETEEVFEFRGVVIRVGLKVCCWCGCLEPLVADVQQLIEAEFQVETWF